MKRLTTVFITLASLNVWASTGFVTPTEMTMTFTSASLITTDNSQKTIVAEGSYPITFRRTDTDFASIALGATGADAGRYIGVNLCYLSARTVKLNGDAYAGPNGSGGGTIQNGNPIYSIGTDATTAGSVSLTDPGTPTTLTGYVVGNGTNQCSSAYFVNTVCVTSSGTTGCEATDTVVTTPNLTVMMDLYDSVGVDPDTKALDAHLPAYPYPAFGSPGAAVHLRAVNSTSIGNMSLIFGPDGGLVYTTLYQTGTNTGFCNMGGANGFVTVSAVPSGAFQNMYGPTPVQKMTTGKIEFASGGCGSGTTCTSSGLQTIDNFKQAMGSTTTVHCEADATGALGYTYTGTGSPAAGTGNVTIKRIMDPSNLLGSICTTGGGICGTY